MMLLFALLFAFSISGTQSLKRRPAPEPCPCSDSSICSNKISPSQKVEAYIVTDGKSQYKDWDWEHITMVLALDYSDPKLMCEAHKRHKGYGFIEKIPSDFNSSSQEFEQWLTGVSQVVNKMYADAFVLDLLNLVGDCLAKEYHISSVIDAVKRIYVQVKRQRSVQLICVMPWKPPCYENNCDLTDKLNKYCDFITTSPDSYNTFCDLNCKARATVPKSKLVLGLDEYISSGVQENKLLMGVPWHGYDYTCETFRQTLNGVDICTIPRNDTTKRCDYKNSRRRLTLGFIMETYTKYFNKHNWHGQWAAPYFYYSDIPNNKTHQVWFEGYDSLRDKYMLVRELGIRGVMIWTGDDLSNKEHVDQGNGVWYWLVHTLFLTGDHVNEDLPGFAAKAAGIGVGCFLGGCLVGFAITCIATRRTLTNLKLRRPFDKDLEEINGDAYHDEDDGNL